MGMNTTTTIAELESAIATMQLNGTARKAPGRFRLLKERLAKMKSAAPSTEDVAAGQREWQAKWESGEFTREAQARRARLEANADGLLATAKAIIGKWERGGYGNGPCSLMGALSEHVRRIEGK